MSTPDSAPAHETPDDWFERWQADLREALAGGLPPPTIEHDPAWWEDYTRGSRGPQHPTP
jgi:hypothetical protein